MFNLCRQTILIVVTSISTVSYSQVLQIEPENVEAKAWIIYDPQSQQVIAASAQDQQRAPASLTKMMVGYLSLQAIQQGKLKLDQIVTVPEVVNSVKSDESRLKLKVGEQITVEELISGLIIMSANDAALTLATLISGDIPHFLQLMNQTAKQLGMHNTHFSNPSGITMQDHYSSALDLALLSQTIVETTPNYLLYSKQQEFRYKDIHHHATNILLKKDATVDGLKTGYTEAAGYNLALTANRLDPNTNEYRRLIVVVMGTANKQKRADVAENLINVAYHYTQSKRLFLHSQKIADIPVLGAKQTLYSVMLPQSQNYNTLSLLPQNMSLDLQNFNPKIQRFILNKQPLQILQPLTQPQDIHYSIQLLTQQLEAPLLKNAVPLATINVQQFGRNIHSMEIQQDIKLSEANWWQRFTTWCKTWLQSIQGEKDKPVIYPIS